ncbi:single-stranded-DNA-specific exonuclease RecJ [Pseudorhodoplanes sp.]|uniref:single-stranded-DNA-specific exonuclease RecJ n=1 Tax=Pseudorhodoplanes sp. TaxID=1934341 RepID=UPI002C03FA7F|nr:single-stranded-DNA-specific exonuclease RecJ [Pseudorhodoplanes sp.]HWV54982.1 single-stranded-DNA-specific exonuclease RecJ [Pseudorhodoplanes sp.]
MSEAPQRFFLGVEKSVRGRAWRDRLDARGTALALAIAQRHGVPDMLARILAGRGIEAADADGYLDPAVKRLMPDPDTLTGMRDAAARIADAIVRSENVAIFGDYDVDGATSSALLARYLRHFGLNPVIHIPDRLFEGYGPNVDAIRGLAERGATLLVTVDCGTTSIEPLTEAARLKLDTVVIDHHQCDPLLPPAVAIVNPNRLDDLSGLNHLAAVGLVFMTLVATNRELRRRGFFDGTRSEPDLLGALDLVALGTIADVVPLRGLNRAFVSKGLISMRRRENVGLTALMDAARLDGPPEPYHLGFVLGPRINAGGRIGRADLGANLLLEEDPTEAGRIAAELDRLNRERQAMEQQMLAEAEAEALAALGLEEKGAVVVTASEGWHPGIVGLVAARLKEKFARPAFAIALGVGGIGTGSGRSIQGVDLGRAVRKAVADGLLLKGGGHAMAAGITIRRERLAEFRAYLEAELGDAVEAARRDEALLIDGALSAATVSLEFCASMLRAGPFGAGNPDPVFALPAHIIAFADIVGDQHIRARLRSVDGAFLNAIAFRSANSDLGRALIEGRGQSMHVAGQLSVDRWQGAERVQLRLLDVARTDRIG